MVVRGNAMAFHVLLLPVGRYVTMHGWPDRWLPAFSAVKGLIGYDVLCYGGDIVAAAIGGRTCMLAFA